MAKNGDRLVAGRYFLHNWPKLCWLAFDGAHCFGVVVCKADDHRGAQRGYIAMLVVEDDYRGLGVGEAFHPPAAVPLLCMEDARTAPVASMHAGYHMTK